MKTKKPGITGHLLTRLSAFLKASRLRRRRREVAVAKLRAFSVLPTRPGGMLHL